jgi:hypothetical protein
MRWLIINRPKRWTSPPIFIRTALIALAAKAGKSCKRY